MRKLWLFIIIFLLMHLVALTWMVTPISQEGLTMLYDDRWVIKLVTCVLCGIAGVLIAREDD